VTAICLTVIDAFMDYLNSELVSQCSKLTV